MFDLHFHSLASDGLASLDTVAAAVAARPDLALVALTDHDYLDYSIALASREPRAWTGVELISQIGSRRLDILGLNVRPDDRDLTRYLETRVIERRARFALYGELLRAAGWTFDPPAAIFARTQLAAPHVVAELRRQPVNEARLAALGIPVPDRSAPVNSDDDKPIYKLILNPLSPLIKARTETAVASCVDIIGLIHRAGGLAIVAHPWISPYDEGRQTKTKARRLLLELIGAGLDGLELWHHDQTAPAVQAEISQFAAAQGLLVSAGSDDHSLDLQHLGTALPAEIDGRPLLDKIRAAARRRAQARRA